MKIDIEQCKVDLASTLNGVDLTRQEIKYITMGFWLGTLSVSGSEDNQYLSVMILADRMDQL